MTKKMLNQRICRFRAGKIMMMTVTDVDHIIGFCFHLLFDSFDGRQVLDHYLKIDTYIQIGNKYNFVSMCMFG